MSFFGDELESIRYFNPQSQISRDKINQVDISPGGEVGLLRQIKDSGRTTLLEHLPEDSILLFCDPDSIEEMAAQKVMEIPPVISSTLNGLRYATVWMSEISVV